MSQLDFVVEYGLGLLKSAFVILLVLFWVRSGRWSLIKQLIFFRVLYVGCVITLAADVIAFWTLAVLTRGSLYVSFVPGGVISESTHYFAVTMAPIFIRIIGEILIVIGAALFSYRSMRRRQPKSSKQSRTAKTEPGA